MCEGAVGSSWTAPPEGEVAAHADLVLGTRVATRMSYVLKLAASVLLDKVYEPCHHHLHALQRLAAVLP